MNTKIANPWYVCTMLAVLYMVANVDRFIINLMVEPMKRDFMFSDTQIALLIGLTFSLFYVLCGIPLARFADRSNRRNILAVGVTAWSLMTAVAGFAQNFWHLFIARMGVGVGESTIAPCAHSMMADTLPPEQLSKGFAIYSLGAVIGGALAYVLGGPLIAWAATAFPNGIDVPVVGNIFSWQLVFIIVGLPGILIALLFVLTVREPKRSTDHKAEESIPLQEVWAYLKTHWKVFLSIYGGIAALQISAGGFSAWLPAMLERKFDVGPAAAPPYLVLSFILPGFASAIAAGWFGDKLLKSGFQDSHLRISAFSTLICVLPFSLAPLAPNPELMTFLLAIGFFFAYMHIILCPTALQLISPGGMRSVMASLVMVSQILIGAGTGPIIVALITDLGFGDESQLHLSMVIVSLIGTSLAAAAFFFGRKPFGELMRARKVEAS